MIVGAAAPILPVPARFTVPDDVASDRLPPVPAADASDLPPGGETDGRRQLDLFVRSDLRQYAESRYDLASDATSRLSPYLRFGFVSANEVVSRAAREGSGDAFVRQLAWRDFFRQLLAADPRLLRRDLRPGPTPPGARPDTEEALERWRAGETGVPLVDAGMRQLLREGWMHNRARMVAASFLTRRLGVPWQDGAGHFMWHLVDGDPANNAGGWQGGGNRNRSPALARVQSRAAGEAVRSERCLHPAIRRRTAGCPRSFHLCAVEG